MKASSIPFPRLYASDSPEETTGEATKEVRCACPAGRRDLCSPLTVGPLDRETVRLRAENRVSGEVIMRASSLVCVVVAALLGACAPEKQTELKSGAKAIILTGTVSPVQEAEVLSPVSAVVKIGRAHV